MTTNPTHDQVTEAVDAEFTACHRELRDALGVTGRATWSELIAKVRDLAVTDCAPAPVAQATSAPLDHGMASVHVELAKLRRRSEVEASGANDLASLRAELTALGKHVEDVERRAYAAAPLDGTTKDITALDRLVRSIEGRLADVEARIGQPGPIDALRAHVDELAAIDREAWGKNSERLDHQADAIALWQAGVDRLAAKVDAAIETGTKRWGVTASLVERLGARVEALEETSAGKAETLEAVRSLTDAVTALNQRVENISETCGELEQQFGRHEEDHEKRVAQVNGVAEALHELDARVGNIVAFDTNFRVNISKWRENVDARTQALEMKVAELVPRTTPKVNDPWRGPPVPLEREEALEMARAANDERDVALEPLDLATLRVPCDCEPSDGASLRDGKLAIGGDGYGQNAGAWIALTPSNERLLARALMQDANEREARAKGDK